MLDWPLIDGWPRVLFGAIGLLSLGFLLDGRVRRWWTVKVPIAVGIGVIGAVVVKVVVDDIWQPFPEDPLPTEAIVAVGLLSAAIALAAMKEVRWPGRLLAVLAVAGVAISGAAAVNQHYGEFPTMRAVLGVDPDNESDLQRNFVPADQLVVAPAGSALSTVWTAPPGMPDHGTLAEVPIPGTTSGFPARNAWIYLPPAYLTTPRAALPVVVMMAGAPGQPRDWIDGGQLATVMDAYAAEHAGLAPVIVVVDNLGASFANPACVDSPLGNVLTYLRVDVPQWIKSNLQVDQDAEQWAVGGLSSGGTCALLLAVNAPDVYRSFVSISGEDRITIGDPTKTLNKLFGGSQSAFDAVDPLSVMKSTTFPDTAGFVVGGTDDTYLPQAKRVAAAGTAAGMTITYVEIPGGHEWRVWGAGFVLAVPWLAMRTGLVVR
jgi:S-formylglutathione hydrolase FrmB